MIKNELAGVEQMQRNNTSLKEIITVLETGTGDGSSSEHFQLNKGILFKKAQGLARDWKLLIPGLLI